MKALVLRDVGELAVEEIAKPVPLPHEVLLRIESVGVCGTDFHIFEGLANYNLDQTGQPISLQTQAQVLGHEFCGTIVASGSATKENRVGQRVVADQVRTCLSEGRSLICEFCGSGDSHQCEHGRECGITGIPGAFSEYIAVPAVNVIPVPDETPAASAALVEPLGCIFHAMERMEQSANRYCFGGRHPIRSILILGGGPAGLLFLQYLRKIRKFDGNIVLADRRPRSLELAARFGASAVDVSDGDCASRVLERNGGAGFELLIEATGNGRVFDWLPRVARRQATLLLYGAGHGNLTSGCLIPWQAMEFTVATSAGASGCIGADGLPVTYARALRAMVNGQIEVEPIVTHRYDGLGPLIQAFEKDYKTPDFVKAVMVAEGRNK